MRSTDEVIPDALARISWDIGLRTTLESADPPNPHGSARRTMIHDISMIVMAVAACLAALCALVVTARLAPLARELDRLTRDGDRLVLRLGGIAEQLEHAARDARRVERRVAALLEPLLDQVEPPLRLAGSLLAGLRAGLGALLAERDGPASEPSSRVQTEPPGGTR